MNLLLRRGFMNKYFIVVFIFLLSGCKYVAPCAPVKPITHHYKGENDLVISGAKIDDGFQFEVGHSVFKNLAMAISFSDIDGENDENQLMKQTYFEFGPEIFIKNKYFYFLIGGSMGNGSFAGNEDIDYGGWTIDTDFTSYSVNGVVSLSFKAITLGVAYKSSYLDFDDFDLVGYTQEFDYSDINTTLSSAGLFGNISIKQLDFEIGLYLNGTSNEQFHVDEVTGSLGLTYHLNWGEKEKELKN